MKFSNVFWGMFLFLFLTACHSGSENQSQPILIKGTTILTVNKDNEVIKNGAILIRGDSIAAIYQHEKDADTLTGVQIIDGSNTLTIPGLINMHTHAAMTLFRGLGGDVPLDTWLHKYIFPAEKEFVDSAFVYDGTILAAAEMIQSGTTTFNNMYFFGDVAAQAAEKAGIRAIVSESCMDFPTPSSPTYQEALQKTRYLYKKWKSHPLIKVSVCPHSTYLCDTECLKAAGALADELNLPIHIHLSETVQKNQTVRDRYGKTPTELLHSLGLLKNKIIAAHGVHLTERDQQLLQKYHGTIVHNPQSNLKLGSGIAPIAEYVDKGINVALGTDGAASNNNLDMIEEMRSAALLQKGVTENARAITATQVLRMATINGAKALGMEKDIGSIEVGKKADLVLLNTERPRMQPLYDPIGQVVYVAESQDVSSVMVNGQWILKEGQLLTIDEKQLLQKTKKWQDKIANY